MSNEHNGWYNKVFSAAYDPFMSVVEKNALSGRRQALLGNLSGKILELGCGTGINFEFYPASAEVLAIEPSDAMRLQAHAFWSAGTPLDMCIDVYTYDLGRLRDTDLTLQVAIRTEAIDSVTGQVLASATEIKTATFAVRLAAPRSAR